MLAFFNVLKIIILRMSFLSLREMLKYGSSWKHVKKYNWISVLCSMRVQSVFIYKITLMRKFGPFKNLVSFFYVSLFMNALFFCWVVELRLQGWYNGFAKWPTELLSIMAEYITVIYPYFYCSFLTWTMYLIYVLGYTTYSYYVRNT